MFPRASAMTLQTLMYIAASHHPHLFPFPYPFLKPETSRRVPEQFILTLRTTVCDATPQKLLDGFCCLMPHFED